jgi:pimeloyl-ACP methyl ester carboxylesterase
MAADATGLRSPLTSVGALPTVRSVQKGCDPDELERMAPRYRSLAVQLRATRSRLAAADRGAWRGPVARRCWGTIDRLEPLLGGAAIDLDALSRRVVFHAAEQRRASLGAPGHAVLRSSTVGDGRWVARTGAADAAVVVVLVPGVGTTRDDRGALRRDATAVWQELAVAAGGRSQDSVAVVSWLGYDPPDHVLAGVARGPARAGGRQLARDLHQLRREGAQRLVVVGHSYGAVVGARSAQSGGPVDELVVLGSPGLGVGSVVELRLGPGADLWAALAERDPIGLVAATGVVHGPDPRRFARSLPTSLPGHGAYLDDPVLLAALAELSLADLSLAGVGAEPVPSPRPDPTERRTRPRGTPWASP